MEKKSRFTPYDPADHLNTEGRINAFLNEVYANGTETEIKMAEDDVLRARERHGISQPTVTGRKTVCVA